MRCAPGSMALVFFLAASAGCSIETADAPVNGNSAGGEAPATSETTRIQINGSSTVEKIAAAVSEQFEDQFRDVQIAIQGDGTGKGFSKMIAGEIDIATASRPIKDSEKADCDKNGIELLELKVALDGLTIAVNHDNNWCAAITVADLKRIWGPDSAVATWKDINPGWPAEDIRLYGPGTESGTFDYFTEVINGKAGQIRSKYDKSADDNVILAGISGDKYAMGFFGCAYYFLNKDKVKAVKVSPTENIADAVELTPDNVLSGTYTPLSRPLMIYVRKSALARHEVSDFVNFFLNDGQAQVTAVNYVRLNAEDLAASREAFGAAIKK